MLFCFFWFMENNFPFITTIQLSSIQQLCKGLLENNNEEALVLCIFALQSAHMLWKWISQWLSNTKSHELENHYSKCILWPFYPVSDKPTWKQSKKEEYGTVIQSFFFYHFVFKLYFYSVLASYLISIHFCWFNADKVSMCASSIM